MSDLLIKSVTPLMMAEGHKVSDNGTVDILIKDGRIADMAPTVEAGEGIEEFDGADFIAMPGLVDTHRHTWQTMMRGIAGDWTLVEYVENIRLGLAAAYTPEDVYYAAYVGALEAIDTGVTALCDYAHIMISPEHAEAAVAGLKDSGIRARFGFGFYPVPSAGTGFTNRHSRVAFLKEAAAKLDGIEKLSMCAALTEFGLSTEEEMEAEINAARELGALITVHVGTMGSPHGIKLLSDRGLLADDMLLVHANLATDDELRLAADAGCGFSITPETELQMGMGFPITNRVLDLGGKPTFGVDIVSDYSGDFLTQIRFALQTARALDNQAQLDDGKHPRTLRISMMDAMHWATDFGAEAIKIGDGAGKLEIGGRADIALIRTTGLNYMPKCEPIAAVMLQSRPGDVSDVLIGGEFVKRDGAMLGVDMAALKSKVDGMKDALFARAADMVDMDGEIGRVYEDIAKKATFSQA